MVLIVMVVLVIFEFPKHYFHVLFILFLLLLVIYMKPGAYNPFTAEERVRYLVWTLEV